MKIKAILILAISANILALLAVSCSMTSHEVSVAPKTTVAPSITPDEATQELPTPQPTQTVTMLPDPTPTPQSDDPASYYGGLVITLDYVGQTIQMKPKQGFLLRLGSDFNWSVSIEPDGALSRNINITLGPGEQGVFIARQKGEARLSAVGVPVCYNADPPCMRPNVLFEIILDIQ